MEEIIYFFSNLLEVTDWPARWNCGKWSSFHGWLYIGSDLAIWLAYFIIPAIILLFIQQRKNLPFLPIFWLFSLFIICCGATHLIDAIIFWWPAYRLSGILKFITAVVSLFTVISLIRDLPKLLLAVDSKNEVSRDEKSLIYLENKIEEQKKLIELLQKELSK